MTTYGVRSQLATVIADAMQDVKLSIRQMRRAPSQSALIVLTLALGIGANVTMVDAVDRLLLQPPPGIRAPEDVARLVFATPFSDGDVVGTVSSYATMLDLDREVAPFDGVHPTRLFARYWDLRPTASTCRPSWCRLRSSGYWP